MLTYTAQLTGAYPAASRPIAFLKCCFVALTYRKEKRSWSKKSGCSAIGCRGGICDGDGAAVATDKAANQPVPHPASIQPLNPPTDQK